ncbi:MAG: hypothetical protein KA321_01440 [Pseudomonadales bacterium]|nr:hypothetical protein [Pseudomonadales bacterium]
MRNPVAILLLLVQACLLGAVPGLARVAAAADGKIGIIGDSMAAGTHSLDACGRRDIVDCVEQLGGFQDHAWSHARGAHSWSIASRLGFAQSQVVDAADDGEEWKDAADQAAMVLGDPQVDTVFIGLGANDICQKRGHDYSGDLEVVAAHIDRTLQMLTDGLAPGATIYWTAVPDVASLYGMLRTRDHNLLFESCQATWDLDSRKVSDGAASEACDHYFDNNLCQLADAQEQAKDRLVGLFLDQLLQAQGVDEGPCGKILSSDSTEQDRQEGRQFNVDLNRLMAEKARAFDGRNGVKVLYSEQVFRPTLPLGPEHISRFDCYHPSRAGQLFLADQMWRGFGRNSTQAFDVLAEDFQVQDYCRDGQRNWNGCWVEHNDDDNPATGDVRIGDGRLQVEGSGTGLERAISLGAYTRGWLSFNWARDDLDRTLDYVAVEVSGNGGLTWAEVDRFGGDADDLGLQRGDYYDIGEHVSPDTRVRLRAAAGLGAEDRVLFDNVQLIAWNDTPELAWHEAPAQGSVQSGVGLIRGWACDAGDVSIAIDDGERIPIAGGGSRADTAGVCGDADNGYGMVMAWGLLGNGSHRMQTFVDEAQVANVEFEVLAIGDGFVEGLQGEYELAGFPAAGDRVRVTWSEADQNFLVTGLDTGAGFADPAAGFSDPSPTGTFPAAEAQVGGAHHESPAQHSIQSGVGLIRGWACEARDVTISIDGGAPIRLPYGTSRADTRGVCGDDDNGYGMVFAWGLLGNGTHRLRTFVDGVAIADVEFAVQAIGNGFVEGLEGSYTLDAFPSAGQAVDVRWSQPDQNFRIIGIRP